MTKEQKDVVLELADKAAGIIANNQPNSMDYQDSDTVAKIVRTIDEILRLEMPSERVNILYSKMKEHSFCLAPASTKFHGNHEKGLLFHIYGVLVQAIYFTKPFLENFCLSPEANNYTFTFTDIVISVIAHDFCKMSLYEKYDKWSKDENGQWFSTASYRCRQDNRNLGHGNESVLLLLEFLPEYASNRIVIEAISRHMGFSDLSQQESYNYSNFLENPLVVLLQLADQTATAWFKL